MKTHDIRVPRTTGDAFMAIRAWLAEGATFRGPTHDDTLKHLMAFRCEAPDVPEKVRERVGALMERRPAA